MTVAFACEGLEILGEILIEIFQCVRKTSLMQDTSSRQRHRKKPKQLKA